MGLMSPKHVVLGILNGYPATEVDLLIPSDRKVVRVRVSAPAPFGFSGLRRRRSTRGQNDQAKLGQNWVMARRCTVQRARRGVLAVLDPRLTTKRYGKVFLESLPDYPVVRDIVRCREFFDQA